MANDFSVDELNEKLNKTNQLLKEAEKRFEDLLKVVKNLQNSAGKGGMYGSDATTEIFKRAEKKTTEFNKQMDKMHQVRQMLIDAEYDRVGDLEKERQERTKQFILMRRETHAMVESQKTKRKEMSLQAKRLDLIGRMAGGAGGGLAGFIGMGVGTAIGGFQQGTEGAGKKAGGLQQRMLNYQKQMEQSKYSSTNQFIGTEKSQKAFISRMEKISPKLTDLTFGKKEDDGDRKGGALGKGAGAIGKMGGALGLAGGIGGGLLGGAIMKGLESSPMFQAISKIMSTAFNLILRPIGDFFSAVFKPISIVLMKWGAVNLRKWAQGIQDGTNEIMNTASLMGKGLIAFFNNPLEFLGVAFQQLAEYIRVALDPFANEVEPILDKYITGTYDKINADLDAELGTIGGAVAAGAGQASDIQTKMKTVQESLDKITENTKPITTPFGGYGSAEEQQSELQRLMKESQEMYAEAWEKAMSGKQTNVDDTGAEEATFNYDKAVELSGFTAEQWENMSEDSKKVYQKYIEYKENADKQQKTNEVIQETYLTMSKLNQDTNTSMASYAKHSERIQRLTYDAMRLETRNSKGYVEAMAKEHEEMLFDIKQAYDRAQAILASMQNSGKRGSSSNVASNPWGRAGGGVINERIFGIGERSGGTYMFGEAGREFIVPESKSGGLGNININVNIDKVTSDVDLQKLKPIIERAILEVHARRGII